MCKRMYLIVIVDLSDCSSRVTQRSKQDTTSKGNAYEDKKHNCSMHPSNIVLPPRHTSYPHNGKYQARNYANDDTYINSISSFPASCGNQDGGHDQKDNR